MQQRRIDLKDRRLVAVVVRLEIDYIRPVFWNPVAELNVRTKLLKIESYSVYLEQLIEDAFDGIMAKAVVRLSLFDRHQEIPVVIDLEELKR